MDEDENEYYNHVFIMRPHKRSLELDAFLTFPVWYSSYLEARNIMDDLQDEELDKEIQRISESLMGMKIRCRYNDIEMYSFILPVEMSRSEFENLVASFSVEKFDKMLEESRVT